MEGLRACVFVAVCICGCRALQTVHASAGWEAAVNAFADEISATTLGMNTPTVALTVAGGKHYVTRYPELLVHYRQIANLPFAVVALDQGTRDYFAEHGVPTMLFDTASLGVTNVAWYWKGDTIVQDESLKREAVMRGKFETTAALLERGVRVVFSEIDVFWKKDPLSLLTGASLLMEQHDYARLFEVNVGFFIAVPANDTRRVFSNVRRWLNMPGRGQKWCGTYDQAIFDFAIRCVTSHKLLNNCNVTDAEQRTLCDTMFQGSHRGRPVNWEYIPWEAVPHPPRGLHFGQNASDPEMRRFLGVLDTAVAAHIWSGFAKPGYQQMRFAYEHGFWSSKVPFDVDTNA